MSDVEPEVAPEAVEPEPEAEVVEETPPPPPPPPPVFDPSPAPLDDHICPWCGNTVSEDGMVEHDQRGPSHWVVKCHRCKSFSSIVE